MKNVQIKGDLNPTKFSPLLLPRNPIIMGWEPRVRTELYE